MAKDKKSREKPPAKAGKRDAFSDHTLDRLYATINSRKDDDRNTSRTARLFSRGRAQIAKKVGEEAVEVMIEGIRGDRAKLIAESADLLYHLLAMWAAAKIRPGSVWRELERREGLSHPTALVRNR
jgi:phosphoribosyl-ATP pyrophosphohydrolase